MVGDELYLASCTIVKIYIMYKLILQLNRVWYVTWLCSTIQGVMIKVCLVSNKS